MKQFILCFLLLAGFTAQAQELISFQDASGKYGYKDESGKIIVQPKYEYANPFFEELAAVKQNGKYGFIDKTGKEVIKPQYDDAMNFHEGLAPVARNKKWGFVDKTGKEIIKLQYDYAMYFYEGLAEVTLNKKSGFIDKTGKVVIEIKYDRMGAYLEGLVAVNIGGARNEWGGFVGGKWGFIDKTGKEVIKLQYDDAMNFHEGLAPVELNKKWGFVDKTGKEIIKLQYESALEFENNKAYVKLNGRNFYIDKTGKEIGSNPQSTITTTTTSDKPATSTAGTSSSKSETISPAILNKLEGLWIQNYDDDKQGMFVSYFKLKIVNGRAEAWRVAEGKSDIKYTSFAVYRNDKGILSFNYELNIPPGFKYEGTGEINEDISAMKAIELRTVKNLDMPMPPAQWTAKKNTSSTLATATKPTASTSSTPQRLTATTSDPAETKFVTAFNAATDSKSRGKALGVLFGDVYKNASLTDAQKKSYMTRKVGEVYAIDKEAAYKGVMGAECSTKEIKEVYNSLPADQKAFITKRANEVTSDFKVVKPISTTTNTTTNTTASTPAITTTPTGEAGLVWFKTSASSDKYGLMNSTTKSVLIKPQYGSVKNFSDGLAAVQFYGGLWGYIDKTGKGIVPSNYEYAGDFSEGLAAVLSYDKWGFIDKTGKEIIKPKYDKVYRFSEDLAGVQLNGKWGYIDKTGKEIIPFQYQIAFLFTNGKAYVKLNDREFYIDKTGKEIK